MLNDFTGADRVYIACGYTDLRRGINGLAAMVRQEFDLDPFTNTLFLLSTILRGWLTLSRPLQARRQPVP